MSKHYELHRCHPGDVNFNPPLVIKKQLYDGACEHFRQQADGTYKCREIDDNCRQIHLLPDFLPETSKNLATIAAPISLTPDKIPTVKDDKPRRPIRPIRTKEQAERENAEEEEQRKLAEERLGNRPYACLFKPQ